MINERGMAIIKHYEGLLDGKPDTPGLDPYLDPINIPTIGWGSIWDFVGKRVTMDHRPITKDEAQALLDREITHVTNAIVKLVRVNLSIPQFSALTSLTYNIGSGNLQNSTLRMKLNRGDFEGAADEFPKWRKAGGRILRGLVRRRASERALFMEEDN